MNPPNQTPTPRTDAALEWVRPMGNDSGPPHEQYVSADFAREIERENVRLRAALEASRRYMGEMPSDPYSSPQALAVAAIIRVQEQALKSG